MSHSSQRSVKRSQTWPDTVATLKMNDVFQEAGRNYITFKGRVGDLSAGGMFFETAEAVPVQSKAEIEINFDPSSKNSNILLKAVGETVRAAKNGVGIRFVEIDLAKLQQCIIARMNKP